MYDPCIGGCDLIQGVYPTYQYALDHNEILGLDVDSLKKMGKISKDCGLTDVSFT